MQYHYIPRSKAMLSEALLEDAPVTRGWFGEPIFGRKIYAMDGYQNISEEENEIADMTPAQYKKWAMNIGTKPRKGFKSELIYNKITGNNQTQKTNIMNIEPKQFAMPVGVGIASAVVATMLGSKNWLNWGLAGMGTAFLVRGVSGLSQQKTTTPATPPVEESQNAVGVYPTRRNGGDTRTLRVSNIPSRVGDKFTIVNDTLSANGGERTGWFGNWFKPKGDPAPARKICAGIILPDGRCKGQWVSTEKMTYDSCKRMGYSHQWCKANAISA